VDEWRPVIQCEPQSLTFSEGKEEKKWRNTSKGALKKNQRRFGNGAWAKAQHQKGGRNGAPKKCETHSSRCLTTSKRGRILVSVRPHARWGVDGRANSSILRCVMIESIKTIPSGQSCGETNPSEVKAKSDGTGERQETIAVMGKHQKTNCVMGQKRSLFERCLYIHANERKKYSKILKTYCGFAWDHRCWYRNMVLALKQVVSPSTSKKKEVRLQVRQLNNN